MLKTYAMKCLHFNKNTDFKLEILNVSILGMLEGKLEGQVL